MCVECVRCRSEVVAVISHRLRVCERRKKFEWPRFYSLELASAQRIYTDLYCLASILIFTQSNRWHGRHGRLFLSIQKKYSIQNAVVYKINCKEFGLSNACLQDSLPN